MNLSIVIPAYLEADNLKKLLPNININIQKNNSISDYEILVIDAIEKIDETEEICESIDNVKYYHRENGNNYGDAIRTGIKKAKNEYILVMDADGSHSPNEIYKLLNKCEDFDLTIGSRYIKNGKTENNFILIFMSWMVNIAYKFFLNIKVKDISNSFRLYKSSDLKQLELKCDNFDIVEEILIKLNLEHVKYKIREVPITFRKREFGKSKRRLLKFIISYIKTMRRLIRIKRSYK